MSLVHTHFLILMKSPVSGLNWTSWPRIQQLIVFTLTSLTLVYFRWQTLAQPQRWMNYVRVGAKYMHHRETHQSCIKERRYVPVFLFCLFFSFEKCALMNLVVTTISFRWLTHNADYIITLRYLREKTALTTSLLWSYSKKKCPAEIFKLCWEAKQMNWNTNYSLSWRNTWKLHALKMIIV